MYKGEVNCEECEVEISPNRDTPHCDDCYNKFYCECGNRLEDSYGEPGDGFCTQCR